MPTGQERTEGTSARGFGLVTSALLVLAVIGGVLWTFRRLSYGLDFNDEAFYATLAWRFVLGDKPFVDEVNPVQGAALLTRPLVALWTRSQGGTDGLILFLRWVYFASSLVIALAAFDCVRRRAGWPLALVASSFSVLLVPAGLPAPSYNTCASGLFALGLFLAARAPESARPRAWIAAAGGAHALCALCLPTYAAACLFAMWLAARELREGARAWVAYALGGLLALAPFARDLARLGSGTLGYTQDYWGGLRGWAAHALEVLGQFFVLLLDAPALVPVLLLVAWCTRRRGAWSVPGALLALALPLAAWHDRGAPTSLCFATLLGVAGAVACALLPRERRPRELFRRIALPSLAAGLVAAWTSGNGIVNAGFGAWPAALVGLLCFAELARELFESRPRPASVPAGRAGGRPQLLLAAPALLALVGLLVAQRHAYQDDDLAQLTARTDVGPFRGIRSSAEKAGFVEGLRQTVRAHADGTKPILFVLQFPAGYLFTQSPLACRSSWGLAKFGDTPPENDPARFSADVAGKLVPGTLIVRLHSYRYRRDRRILWPRGLVDLRIEPVCDVELQTEEYTLYRLR